jgi:peptide/nickel transport system permease protein
MRLVLSRLLHSVPVLWAATTLVWVFMFIIPGDPARTIFGPTADPETLRAVRLEWGLDLPPLQRYLSWLGKTAAGDLGRSYLQDRPVSEILGSAFIGTFFLASAAGLLAAIAGVLLGAWGAWYGRGASALVTAASLVGVSLPTFWVGLLLMILFSSTLGWLPVSGYGEGTRLFGVHAPSLANLVLPATTLALFPASLIARVTRAALREQISADYIRAARARGLARHVVLWRHALRGALGPVTTLVGLLVASLLGGAVATEIVFAWPGLGRVIFSALRGRDLPVVEGAVLVLTVLFLAANLAVDLACAALDPRIRQRSY